MFLGLGVCLLSLISSVIVCVIDYKMDKHISENNTNNSTLTELEEEMSFVESIYALKTFNSMFWLICILCTLLYSTILPFNYIASGFLTDTYFKHMKLSHEESQNLAGIYMSVPFFIAGFLIPINGFLIDVFGKRAYFILLSSILAFCTFILFYFTTPMVGLVLLGVTYSVFAAVIWPVISLVVRKSHVGFAYGVATSLQNLGLSITPLIVAYIFSKSNSYFTTIIFFVAMTLVSIVFSIALIILNQKRGGNYYDIMIL